MMLRQPRAPAQVEALRPPPCSRYARSSAEQGWKRTPPVWRSFVAPEPVMAISRRLSTVRLADKILVMAQSPIAESGTHRELLAQGGPYAELFSIQARGYLPDVPGVDVTGPVDR